MGHIFLLDGLDFLSRLWTQASVFISWLSIGLKWKSWWWQDVVSHSHLSDSCSLSIINHQTSARDVRGKWNKVGKESQWNPKEKRPSHKRTLNLYSSPLPIFLSKHDFCCRLWSCYKTYPWQNSYFLSNLPSAHVKHLHRYSLVFQVLFSKYRKP